MVRAGSHLVAMLAAALIAQTASAAPRPAVTVTSSGVGYAKTITVSVKASRGGKPVRRALVRASGSMSAPGHMMRVPAVRLTERSPGVYAGSLRFVMLGEWVVRVEVSGTSIAPATARLTIRL